MNKFLKISDGTDDVLIAVNEIASVKRVSATNTNIYLKGASSYDLAPGTVGATVTGYLEITHASDAATTNKVVESIEEGMLTALQTSWNQNIFVTVTLDAAASAIVAK